MAEGSSERVSVLMVDDRQANLTALSAILERPDYDLVTAVGGEQALELCLHQEFAVVLLDVMMPGMDGFEVARLLRSRERTRRLPIIFVTASPEAMSWVYKSYSAGAVDFLRKPFDPVVIRAKVAVFAELFRQRHELLHKSQLLHEAEKRAQELEFAKFKLESERHYRNLGDAIPHIVWMAGPDGSMEYLNRKWVELTGLSAQDSVGSHWKSVIHPDDLDAVEDAWLEGQQTHKGFEQEVRLRLGRGHYHWFTLRALPELDDDLQLVRWLGTFTDVDTQRRAHDKAQAAVHLRDEFLSVASHELKTPLTALKLHVDAIQRVYEKSADLAPAERLVASLTAASRQADRLNALIENLLDVSKIATGRFELNVEEFDLTLLVRESVERLQDEARRAGCEVRIHDSGPVVGSWDRARLEQVIANLLLNAFKYAPGKPVEILLGVEQDQTVLEVIDHGIGIGLEDQRRIFRRFERAVSPRNYGGLGLGLYVVSQIVQSHGGRIDVTSRPNLGSQFRVELPVLPEPSPLAHPTESAPLGSQPH